MSMVDGVCLVVDATDGVMTQTKFVLSKALKQPHMKVMVVINKIDRPTARLDDVQNEIFDLFVNLDATDQQLEYPVVYTSAKEGWSIDGNQDVQVAIKDTSKRTSNDMSPLFTTMTSYISPPNDVDVTQPFSMLVTQIDSDTFLGKILLGRVSTGKVRVGDRLHAVDAEGNIVEAVKITRILCRRGLDQFAVDEGQAGDVISLAGFTNATVNHTLCDTSITTPLKVCQCNINF
jgi:GTP-binding protein